jgi:amino acid transporter
LTDPQPSLRRSIGLIPLIIYGVGVTVGAGIYVLVGVAAGLAGPLAPLSFMLAALIAAPSAFAFAELSARLPRSAGEALYVLEAFGNLRLSQIVGLTVVFVGVVSSATVTNGAAGYISEILNLPSWLTKFIFIGTLGAIAMWGVVQSVVVTVILTLIELGGLLLILGFGFWSIGNLDVMHWPAWALPLTGLSTSAIVGGVLTGTLIAFFAFIGFEDLVNMAEEVHEPERIMPRAITWTLILTTFLYLIVVTVAINVVPPAELAASDAPLALVFERASGHNAAAFAAIAVLATVNTVLVQIIMASRVLYGMVGSGAMPAIFGRINARTQTPVIATGIVIAIVLLLAIVFPLAGLARTTTFIALSIFTIVNLALWRIKLRDKSTPSHFTVPIWVPATGAMLSAAILVFEMVQLIS